jgi:hypothetical protein
MCMGSMCSGELNSIRLQGIADIPVCNQAEAIRGPVTSRLLKHRKVVFLSATQEVFSKYSV